MFSFFFAFLSPYLPPPKIWATLTLIFLIPTGLFSQAISVDRFNEENGLPEGYVYTITQDELGFLWLGTGAGVYRFDGKSFRHFTTRDSLSQDFTTSSFKDSKDRIWFGHFEGGLTLYDQGRFQKILPQSAVSSPVVGMAEASDGAIWMATQRNGLVRIGNDLAYELHGSDFESVTIFSFQIAGERLMLGTDEGLDSYRYREGKVAFEQKIESIDAMEISTILPRKFKKGGLWVGTRENGLFEYFPGTGETNHFDPASLGGIENVYSIWEEENGKVWIGTFGNGFKRFDDSDPAHRMQAIQGLVAQDTLSEDIIKAIFQDRYGQTWMGTYGSGMLRVSEKEFAIYGVEADTFARNINAVFPDANGDFWVGANNGLFQISGENLHNFGNQYTSQGRIQLQAVRRYTKVDGLPSEHITTIAQDEDGGIWVGTSRSGIARMAKGAESFERIPLSDLPLSNMINAIRPVGGGKVWIATQDGAFFYDRERADPLYYSTRNGLAHNNIYDIYPDSKGLVWFATHTNRVSIYDGETFSPLTVTDTGEVTSVNSISEGADGTIWFGTDGAGLYSYDGEECHRVGEESGMISNYCYHIAVDQLGNVWTTHRGGFSRYIVQTGTVIPYSNREFLGIEDNTVFSTMQDSDGNIWFGSAQGLVRHNWVAERTRPTPPHIMIISAEFQGADTEISDEIDLPFGSYRFGVNFLGLTFLKQEGVVYQYKLEGRDEEWSEITSKTHAAFQGLDDGNYTFQVRARSVFGQWNEEPATLSFSIAPPFWKTWWFRALIALSIGGIIFLYVKYRVYRLNKEKVALEASVRERTLELQEEKKKLEAANLEMEKLSLVASETDNAVFIIDKTGKLEWVNPGFTRLTGYSFEEIRSMQKGNNFLSLSTNSEIGQLIQEVVRNNTSIQYESRLPSKHGEKIWVISTLTPILDEEGNLRKIVIIDSNITDRKEAEEEVRNINERLEQLVHERTQELAEANRQLQIENIEHIKTAEQLKATNQELDSFVYRASHDLKGPLASLLGLVNIAKAELASNKVAIRYLDLMERRGERLDTILVDLIEATQVKQAQVSYKKIQPAKVVREVLDIVQFKNNNLNVDFQIDIAEDLEIISDRKMIRAILNNYIENSAKYKDPKKAKATSSTKVELDGDEIVISVTDNGIGIPQSSHSKVFDMFFRGSNTVSGSGLGLYIVKQAVDKLGGSVDMKSKEGVGTTFIARVPNRTEKEIA